MAETTSQTSTPKRKHAELVNDQTLNLAPFNFEFQGPPPDDGSASPRSKVARQFRDLALEGGGGVASGFTGGGGGQTSQSPEPPRSIGHVFDFVQDNMQDGARKRVKRLAAARSPPDGDIVMQAPAAIGDRTSSSEPPAPPLNTQPERLPEGPTKPAGDQAKRQSSPKAVQFAVDTAIAKQSETLANTGSADHGDSSKITKKSATSSATSSATPPTANGKKPRARKRPIPRALAPKPSPPATTSAPDCETESEKPIITDPLRASLTWQDDEITVYDPDDSDDDGTGINGIGFKPTPAIAYRRVIKRREQLAEYRKREEREARSKRNQRRRASPATGLVNLKGKTEQRRVRFGENTTELIGV